MAGRHGNPDTRRASSWPQPDGYDASCSQELFPYFQNCLPKLLMSMDLLSSWFDEMQMISASSPYAVRADST